MSDAATPPTPPTTMPDNVPTGPGRLSTGAVVSLVLGVLGFCTAGLAAVPGLILGIVALTSINKSNGALRGNGLAIAGIVASVVSLPTACLSVGLLLPALGKARVQAKEAMLQAQARGVAQAAVMHAVESRGAVVIDDWENVLVDLEYITPEMLHSPFDPVGVGRCFAFNASAAGLTLDELERAPDLVLLFECVPGSPLTGGPELLWHEKGARAGPVRSVIVYADQSTELVPMERYAELRWEP